eukprot:9557412-Alexandrium_andersonii.AAC.1
MCIRDRPCRRCSSAGAKAKVRAVSRIPLPGCRMAAEAKGKEKGGRASRANAGGAMRWVTARPSVPTSPRP